MERNVSFFGPRYISTCEAQRRKEQLAQRRWLVVRAWCYGRDLRDGTDPLLDLVFFLEWVLVYFIAPISVLGVATAILWSCC